MAHSRSTTQIEYETASSGVPPSPPHPEQMRDMGGYGCVCVFNRFRLYMRCAILSFVVGSGVEKAGFVSCPSIHGSIFYLTCLCFFSCFLFPFFSCCIDSYFIEECGFRGHTPRFVSNSVCFVSSFGEKECPFGDKQYTTSLKKCGGHRTA